MISPKRRDTVRGHRRPRHRVLPSDPAALPCQRLPPARRDLVRVPRDPERDPELHEARPPGRRHPARRGAPRARARHGRHRLRQDDDARVDARPHQPHAPPAHRHDRGPDRDPAPRPRLHRQPARSRARHRELRAGAAARPPSGPGRDPDRRAARRRDRAHRAPGRGVRPPRLLHPAHDRRRRDDRPHDRVLPARRSSSRSARSSPARCAA